MEGKKVGPDTHFDPIDRGIYEQNIEKKNSDLRREKGFSVI